MEQPRNTDELTVADLLRVRDKLAVCLGCREPVVRLGFLGRPPELVVLVEHGEGCPMVPLSAREAGHTVKVIQGAAVVRLAREDDAL